MLQEVYAKKNFGQAYDSDNSLNETDDLQHMFTFITCHLAEPLTLSQLAWHAGMSRYAICRLFQRRFGVSPMRWLWCYRMKAAREMILRCPDLSLTDVAFACGFSCSAHFSRCFKKAYGECPRDFKQALLHSPADRSQTGN